MPRRARVSRTRSPRSFRYSVSSRDSWSVGESESINSSGESSACTVSRLRPTVDALYFRCGTYNRARLKRHSALRGAAKSMAVEITILVGTMTGTADMVAQEVQQALEAAGHQVQIRQMDNLDAGVFQGGGTFLICTSTYGAGDVPDNAQNLFNSLETERPKLDNVTYGIIALG